MATFAATLDFQFTSQVTNGCHRIAYRIQGSGDPYTFQTIGCTPYTPPNPPPVCVAQVNISLDDQLCADVVYEGYVQPCCEDIASMTGRVAFTVTFTPEDPCIRYDVTCDSVGILSIDVTSPGTGYTPGDTPDLIFAPTGDATGYAVVQNNGINAFTLSNSGTGGANGIHLNQQAIAVSSTATAHAFFNYTVTGGIVTAISLTPMADNALAKGAGYTVGDTITLPGVWTVSPVITVDSVHSGNILSVVITDPGTLYTAAPTVTVDAVGSAPTFSVTLDNCPEAIFGELCDGTPAEEIIPIPVGATISECRNNTPFATPAQFTIEAAGCCAGEVCTQVNVTTNAFWIGTVYFTACKSRETSTVKALDPSESMSLGCVISDSIVVWPPSQAANITITPVGPCT